MPPKVPPPPRPDPVTLDQIYLHLTKPDIPYEAKAYHLVALNTVAFHPSVKLFFFEGAAAAAAPNVKADADAIKKLNQIRRESLIKNVAFFLAQRNNAVCLECRWETVSLLGELCRMENIHSKSAPTTPQGILEAKINDYARMNLEYLAQLPWFLPATRAIMTAAGIDEDSDDDDDDDDEDGKMSGSKQVGPSRTELKRRMEEKRAKNEAAAMAANLPHQVEHDEDVVIALQDILGAIPAVTVDGATKKVGWSAEALENAHDLMFLDASTSLLHLIPTVSRSSSNCCAQCHKVQVVNADGAAAAGGDFLRCSSCKAVYYCSVECQRAHWSTAHRTPCQAYKARCDLILEQYYAANAGRKKKDMKKDEVAILEVPLEPTLFFETRRYLYDHRDDSFASVHFNDYFMKYTVRGT